MLKNRDNITVKYFIPYSSNNCINNHQNKKNNIKTLNNTINNCNIPSHKNNKKYRC